MSILNTPNHKFSSVATGAPGPPPFYLSLLYFRPLPMSGFARSTQKYINVLMKYTWLVPPGRTGDCTLLRKIPHVDQKYTGENRRGTELVVTLLITTNSIFGPEFQGFHQNLPGFLHDSSVFSSMKVIILTEKGCPRKRDLP